MLGDKLKNKLRRLHVFAMRSIAAKKDELAIKSVNIVTIVAPHPDDEVIGCGGLIARLVAEGKIPHIIVMTGGEGSHNGCCSISPDEIIMARRGLTHNALSILGVPQSFVHVLNYPDGNINMCDSNTERLKQLITHINPDTIFVPHWGEGWPDHIKTAQILKSICSDKIDIWEYCVWMWYYNVWRGLDWKNAATLHMTPTEHAKKTKAMAAYTQPLAPCGHPWSGVLPNLFLDANNWPGELYFKAI